MKRAQRLRQIGIGVQLRKLREDSGMTTRSVAAALGHSSSSVSRTELGQRVPSLEEINALCGLYGVTGEQKRDLIERVGQTAETASYLESGHISDDLASLMVLEREATAITYVAMSWVPGLAQTADYCRTMLGANDSDGEGDMERRVATRLGRQAILSRPSAPEVTLLLDEAVLHRTLGKATMMQAQLEHLLFLGRRDNVSVYVIPFNSERTVAADPFSFFRLADGTCYAFVEAMELGVFVTDNEEVAHFRRTAQMCRDSALDEEASSALIRKISADIDRT